MLNLEFGAEGNGSSHAYIGVNLPTGMTNTELLSILDSEFKELEKHIFGTHVFINGRVTTPMCLWLGHKLAHISKSVSIFDPKENSYIQVITH